MKGKINIHYVVKSEDQLVDLGAKRLSKHSVTATPSSSSTSIRVKTTKAHNLLGGGHHLPTLRMLAHCSQLSAHFVVIYRGARVLHCSFVAGSNPKLAHCLFSFRDQLRAMDGQTSS